ncbi:MAG: hypothetical protein KDC98_00035 [Planctomycetes bacterium]|nr:hypothetical protein [Planctomycetota bacterium]
MSRSLSITCLSWLLATLQALSAQSDELREKVNHALDTARPALLAHLDNAAHARPGELALVLLAAIHDGVDASDKRFAKAVERLAGARLEQTYDLALRLMVMELLPSFPDRLEAARDDAKKLLKNRDEGAFGYRPHSGQWDLSNTQYGALGLRSAAAVGVKVDRRVWPRLANEIGEQQDSYGGFGYQRGNSGFQSYASMTAAGIAVLAICRQAMGDEDKKDSALTRQIERGWKWFERNPHVLGSADERWSYYFHYGLERAAILCDVEKIADVSWYERGAEMLIDEQLPGGGWRSESDGYQGDNLSRRRGTSVATSFAILFLRRKFKKAAGPITPHIVTLPTIGPNSKPDDVEACAEELKRRGKAALPEVLRALRSDIRNQREAAAAALLHVTGQDFGYDPAKDEDANGEAIKKAELWFLRNR